MIYLTTFILTLFLTQIARALPRACGDRILPDLETPDQYGDPLYDFTIPSPLRTTYDNTFDNAQGRLNGVACSDGVNGLASRYPTFGDLPSFPYIGGAFDIVWNSPNCGGCWKITNKASQSSIYITAIDTAGAGFNVAGAAYKELNSGRLGGALEVTAQKVPQSVCGL
jgi:Cerato-platanin